MRLLTGIKQAIFFICIFIGTAISAYVYEAAHLYNAPLNQHIFLLSDYHEENPESTAQRLSILDTAKKHQAYLLIEDQTFLFQYLDDQEVIAYQPCLQPIIDDLINDPVHFDPNKNRDQDFSVLDPETEGDDTPLYLLTHMARQQGIRANSVEHRQAEIISAKGGPISAQDVCKAYTKAMQDIEQYDDGTLYNAYYNGIIAAHKRYAAQLKNFFGYLHSCSCSLAQAYGNSACKHEAQQCYQAICKDDLIASLQQQGLSLQQAQEQALCESLDPDQDTIYEKVMSALYLCLIDSSIIHEIALHKHAPVIMVYAGGAHIDEVATVLHSNGYTLVDTVENDQFKPINLASYFAYATSSLPEIAENHYSNNYWLTLLETAFTSTQLQLFDTNSIIQKEA